MRSLLSNHTLLTVLSATTILLADIGQVINLFWK